MCTVTFVPAGEKIFITSNRDEKYWRAQATAPEIQDFGRGKILFPKDAKAGGTWFAVHENGNAVVLLNGCRVRHESRPPYRRSRGLILLDLINSECPTSHFQLITLDGIEPFTAIIWQQQLLFVCRWDGTNKSHEKIDASVAHIWSSVTLYDDVSTANRKKWFDDWLAETVCPDLEQLLYFHQHTGDGDSHNDLRMNREGLVHTVSITAATITREFISMCYLDLNDNARHEERLKLETAIPSLR